MKLKFDFINDILKYLTIAEKKKIWWLALMGGVNALCETYSIFVVYLFIRIIQNTAIVHKYDYFGIMQNLTLGQIAIYCGFIVIVFYLIKGIINYINLYITMNFSRVTFSRLSKKSFFNYLNMPYLDFIKLNPAHINDIVRFCHMNFAECVLLIIGLITELFTLIFLVVMLIFVNWKLLLILLFMLAIISGGILKFTNVRNKEVGKRQLKNEYEVAKTVYNSFFNYKLIKLVGLNNKLSNDFNVDIEKFGQSNFEKGIIGSFPKLILELVCFIGLVAGVMIGVFVTNSPEYVIAQATLCLFVLMKITPSLMKTFYSIQSLTFKTQYVNRIPLQDDVQLEDLGKQKIKFNNSIQLKDIAFKYNENAVIFNNVSFTVNKGDRVGLVGPSGVGKSTLQDIIIGLIKPTAGIILIDGIAINADNLDSWRKHIGYIPQEIYLYNGTIAENVVLNRVYDEKRLISALKKAHIYDFLLSKEGIDTQVGNNGVMLSGGQKQRIGIARALYDNPDVLVLDEATSALDEKTEQSIMQEIYSESIGQTLLIITHRISTLSGCNKIFSLDKDGLHLT